MSIWFIGFIFTLGARPPEDAWSVFFTLFAWPHFWGEKVQQFIRLNDQQKTDQ